jgi:hypothetical protein
MPVPAELAASEGLGVATLLTVRPLLERLRGAYDGRTAVMKGAEIAELYPAPWLRPFGDLDVLVDDSKAAQEALLAAGFFEFGEPELFDDIHHLRPLAYPGLPLGVELHHAPKWPAELGSPPSADRLLARAVPSNLGVEGALTLHPADHAVCLAAHAWAHEPLLQIGHLLDIAVVAAEADDDELAAVAREFGFARPWRVTTRAIAALFGEAAKPIALRTWASNTAAVRERSVLESHMTKWLVPFSTEPFPRSAIAAARALARDVRPVGSEPWRRKVLRMFKAIRNARLARTEHNIILGDEANVGNTPLQRIRERRGE